MRKSKNPYPKNWPEIAEEVKKKASYNCVRCGHSDDRKSGHVLTVHHLDMDPQNNAWWNLPALCQKCYLSIQSKVIFEQVWMFSHTEWFKPYVAGYYAHIYKFSEDEEKVKQNADMFISLGQGYLTPVGIEELVSKMT